MEFIDCDSIRCYNSLSRQISAPFSFFFLFFLYQIRSNFNIEGAIAVSQHDLEELKRQLLDQTQLNAQRIIEGVQASAGHANPEERKDPPAQRDEAIPGFVYDGQRHSVPRDWQLPV